MLHDVPERTALAFFLFRINLSTRMCVAITIETKDIHCWAFGTVVSISFRFADELIILKVPS